MELNVTTLLIVCIFVFIAGLVDSIAGGGGLISLPAYLFAGLPAHFALGTNKFSSSIGTIFSTIRFIGNRRIHIESAIASVISALIGSALGARLALRLDEKYLKYFLVTTLPLIAVFLLTRKKFGEENQTIHISRLRIIILSIASGFLIGGYDGFYGPGTGTFLILLYTGVIGFDLTTASGNAKVVNLSSNIAAVITFLLGGKVIFFLGIPAAICGIAGNWIGSGLAIKNGAKVIRPVFIGVLALLFIKVGMEFIR